MDFIKLFGYDPTLIYYGGWVALFSDFVWPLIILLGHWSRRLRLISLYLVVTALVIPMYQALSMIPLEILGWKPRFIEIVFRSASFGVCVYIIACEWLMRGGAKRLTERRGEKWTKEIEYLYLALGAFAILAAVIRSDASLEKIWVSGIFGGLLLTVALVLRLIKTRAEVNGWGKLGAVIDPEGDREARTEDRRLAKLSGTSKKKRKHDNKARKSAGRGSKRAPTKNRNRS